MFVVIFSATTDDLDPEYSSLAKELRSLALDEYGCLEFKSFNENSQELAVSYCPDLASIKA